MKPFRILLMLGLLPAALNAQSVRVSGTTTGRFIHLKPLNGERIAILPLTQDLTLNAWGFGQGLRIYAQARGRAAGGDSTYVWPQATDKFDLLAAYGELDRGRARIRIGRQWKTSSLGFYNFDGASALYRITKTVRAEAYGGWSLLPGESDDYGSSVLDGVEPYAPDLRRNIYGGELSMHVGQRFNASALYQREIRSDNAALYSSRAALNGSVKFAGASLDAAVQADMASNDINNARVQLTAPIVGRFVGGVEARRYRPYFDLWTIWGMFNPVGFREQLGNLRWSNADGSVTAHIGGGLRQYEKDEAGVLTMPLRDDGWRFLSDAQWNVRPDITLAGGYRRDIGFGASRSDGDVSVRYNFGENYISVNGLAYQTIRELQVRDGTIKGLGTDASFKLSDAARFGWSFAVYRNDNKTPADYVDWNQTRGTVWLEWSVGSNPDVVRKPVATRVAEGAK